MTGEHASWTAPDGVTLGQTRWEPQGATRAHVTLIHGYAEHGGRYRGFAHAAAERGFAVHALDLRGHGTSPGPRGDFGSIDRTVEDIVAYVRSMPAPTFLFGHSAGGAASACAAAQLDDLPGLVLSAPYLRNAEPVPGWLRWIAGLLAEVAPGVPVRRLDPNTLSRIPDEVRAYREDPLVYNGPIRAKTGTLLIAMGDRALETASEIDAPVLVIHGADDAVASPDASRAFARRLDDAQVQLEIVPGGYHELLNDLARERATASILAWLEARLGDGA